MRPLLYLQIWLACIAGGSMLAGLCSYVLDGMPEAIIGGIISGAYGAAFYGAIALGVCYFCTEMVKWKKMAG